MTDAQAKVPNVAPNAAPNAAQAKVPVLSVQGLRKSFGGVQAVQGMAPECHPGQLTERPRQ